MSSEEGATSQNRRRHASFALRSPIAFFLSFHQIHSTVFKRKPENCTPDTMEELM